MTNTHETGTPAPQFPPARETAAEIQFSAVPGGVVFRVTYSSAASATSNLARLVARGATIVYTRGI